MDDVWILGYARTPIGRYGGLLASIRPDDLAAHAIRGCLDRAPSLDPGMLGEVVLGCANQAGEDNRNVARQAALLAGVPLDVPAVTVNRLCGSGLDAVAYAARLVSGGECEIALAGGVESMSRAPFVLPKAEGAYDRRARMFDTTIGWRFVNPKFEARFGVDAMGETAENVATECGVGREDQDAFALRSQQRCALARDAGVFAEEIVPVDAQDERGKSRTVDADEHPRPDTSLDSLRRLPTPFRSGGTVTPGNASGVNDGAAALLIGTSAIARRIGAEPIARIVGFATAGVEPRLMGLGPVPATQRLLERFDLGIDDVDVVELNEAFAAQSLACMRRLGLPDDAAHVNPNGGAIALGHPLGMSGARLAGTAALELRRRRAQRALVTMCIGVGQGIAALLEAP
jgi:3-oxoadipyl-CoA thiolase